MLGQEMELSLVEEFLVCAHSKADNKLNEDNEGGRVVDGYTNMNGHPNRGTCGMFDVP